VEIKMNTICLNNITLYPNLEPPKGIIFREFKFKNPNGVRVWITKCKNIYFLANNKHPISKYKSEQSTFVLSHFVYILQDIISTLDSKSFEFGFFNNFLMYCLEFLKYNSANSYRESQEDPIIKSIYFDFFLQVGVDPYLLSYLKSRVEDLEIENQLLKMEIKRDLSNFSNEMNNCFSKLCAQKFMNNSKIIPTTSDYSTMTDNHIIKKDKETQLNNDHLSKRRNFTQTISITTGEKEIQTDNICEKRETSPKIQKKNSKKREEELVVFTDKEYFEIVKSHKEEIERVKNETEKDIRTKLSDFLQKSPITVAELTKILTSCENEKVIGALNAWNILLVSGIFCHSLITKNPILEESRELNIPNFYEFWTGLIYPNINGMKNTIFRIIEEEWINFTQSIKESGTNINSFQINVAFGIYSTNVYSNQWHKQTYMPGFFSVLLNSCRNIFVLLGLINVFYKNPNDRTTRICVLRDFQTLMCMPRDIDILRKYRNIIDEPQLMEIIFDVGL